MSTSISSPLCQTCSSQLTPKAARQAFVPPCCRIPICGSCIAANPRLREYIPCLRCGDLTTKDGESSVMRGRRAQEWKTADENGGEVMFDADGDEIDQLEEDGEELGNEAAEWRSLKKAENPSSSERGQNDKQVLEANEEEEVETVEVRHDVARSDTLLAIARRYAADPHELLSLNNLPSTAISSNPRILQTRKSILISRRRIPKSQLSQLPAIQDDPIDPKEAKRRQEERAVKRFQLVTKTVDPGVGRAYLSLQGSEAAHPLEHGSGEKMDGSGSAKKAGNLSTEDRAVEQWFEDDEWEGESSNRLPKKKDGKWTSVGGSKPTEKTGWFGLKA